MKSISEEQQKQIIQYLQTKNLFEDTTVELSEHFANHINHLISKGKTFEEAFNETQNIWSKDLKNTWIYGFYQIPIIQKRKIFYTQYYSKKIIRLFCYFMSIYFRNNVSSKS